MTSFDQFKTGYFSATDPARGLRIHFSRYEPMPVEGVSEQQWVIIHDDSSKSNDWFVVIMDKREYKSNKIIKYYIKDGYVDSYQSLFSELFPGEKWIDCLNYIAKAIIVANFSKDLPGNKSVVKVYVNEEFLKVSEYTLLEKEDNSDYYLLASASEKEVFAQTNSSDSGVSAVEDGDSKNVEAGKPALPISGDKRQMTSFDQFKTGYFSATDPARGWRIRTTRYELTPVEGVLEEEWFILPDDKTKRDGLFVVIMDQRELSNNNILKYYIKRGHVDFYQRLFSEFFPGEKFIDCLNYIAKAIVVANFSKDLPGNKSVVKVYVNEEFLRSIEYDCALLEEEENSDYYLLASASEKEVFAQTNSFDSGVSATEDGDSKGAEADKLALSFSDDKRQMTSFDQFKLGYRTAIDPVRKWRIEAGRCKPSLVEGVLEESWVILFDDKTKNHGAFFVKKDNREYSSSIIKYYITIGLASDYIFLFSKLFPLEKLIDCFNYIAKAIIGANFYEFNIDCNLIIKVYIKEEFLKLDEYNCALLQKEEGSDCYLLASVSGKEMFSQIGSSESGVAAAGRVDEGSTWWQWLRQCFVR